MGRIKNLSLRKYFFLITAIYLVVAILLSVLCYNLCEKAIDEFGLYRSMDYESAKENPELELFFVEAALLIEAGYKEFVDAIAGRASLESAIQQVQQSSRRYAKRQLTWFRRNENMNWIIREPGMSASEILTTARQILNKSDN